MSKKRDKASVTSVQRWMLAVCSLLAVIVWTRNLLSIVPATIGYDGSNAVLSEKTFRSSRPPIPSLAPYDSASSWRDPFVVRDEAPVQENAHSGSSQTVVMKPREAPQNPPPWNVIGIVATSGMSSAILESTLSNDKRVVSVGDSLGGGLVRSIRPDEVCFRLAKRDWQIPIKQNTHDHPL